jgi:hypothetical protein
MKIFTVSAASFEAHSPVPTGCRAGQTKAIHTAAPDVVLGPATLPRNETIQFGAALPEGLRLRAPLAINIERSESAVSASVAGFSGSGRSTGTALASLARQIAEAYRAGGDNGDMQMQSLVKTYVEPRQPDSPARFAANV